MTSTVSSLAHNTHLTTSKIYHTRTRHTSVNYYQLDDDEDTTDENPNSTQGSAGTWYEVKEIIGETKDKYKILWVGVDPKTNKPWKADWIRKSEVSAPAIAEWEESKRAKGSRHEVTFKETELAVQNHSSSSSTDYQPTYSVADPIVDSSPVTQPHRPVRKRWKSVPEEEDETEDSFDYRTLPTSPRGRQRKTESPVVELTQESSQFDRTEYLKFSDLPASQNPGGDQRAYYFGRSPPLQPGPKRLFRLATLQFNIDEEIPDSQPSFPSSAYISTVESGTDLSSSIVEGGAGKDTEGDGHGEDDTFSAEGAQPRSPWYRRHERSGDSFTDFLEPLLRGYSGPIHGPDSGKLRGLAQDTGITQDEDWRLSFASQPAELDRSVERTITAPSSRSPSPYIGLSDADIPPLSLSEGAMADQQTFHSPTPSAGPQTPSSTGKLSLRERLAQARLGFNDAVSAFRATPTRVEALSERESPSPSLSSQSPTAAPQHGPLFKSTGQQASMVPSCEAEAEVKNPRASPLPDLQQSTLSMISQDRSSRDAHSRPNSIIPQSQSVKFASQLQASLSSLPQGNHEFAPSQAALTQMNSYSSLPTSPKLAPGEHVIMIGMSRGQKEAYLQNINNKSRSIQMYCNGGFQDDEQVEKDIRELLRTAGRIATHLDLATDQQLDWEQQDVGYALQHPKFKFLKTFLDAIRYQSLSIAILAEPGKTLDILEPFLKGIKIRCRRTDGFNTVPMSQNEIDGSVNILLCPTGPKGTRVLGSYASLVIGLDSTFNIEDEQVGNFRIHPLDVGRLSPVLKLATVNTVEHVMLFLPPQSKHYLSQVMPYVAILRQQAGSLPAECVDEVQESAKNIAKIIIEMSEKNVEIALVTPDIPGLPVYESASQSSTQQPSAALTSQALKSVESTKVASEQETPRTGSRTSSTSAVVSVSHAGDKRRWEETSQEVQVAGTEEFPEKKRKVVNTLPTSSRAPDISHISDSQPNTQAPRVMQEQESSMDIDLPEQEVTRVSQPMGVLGQEDTQQDMEGTKKSQDSTVSLVIRENGDGEVSGPGDQTSGEGSCDLMEGLTYNQHGQAGEASSENRQAVIPQASTEDRSNVPGEVANAGLDSNSDSVLESPAETNSDAETGQKPDSTAEQVDGTEPVVIDGEMEQDDFEYPEFEKPLKLPSEFTLFELNPDQLRQLFLDKSRELQEWVKSTSRLQLRFEQMRKEVKSLNSELKRSKNLEVQAQERMTRLNTEVVNLQDERNQLRQDLQQARAMLLSSDKPDVVKMEELRAQNAKLKEEVTSLTRQLESTKSEVDYARDAYQKATRAGGDRAKEAEELRRINEELERKADERAVKLREVQFSNQSKVKDQQIDKLKHLLSEREERIRRLEFERNSIGYKGGRPLGTRATSVPRRGSPSTSRTSSPGPGALPGNSTLPTPTGRDHPTRPFLPGGRRSNNNNKE